MMRLKKGRFPVMTLLQVREDKLQARPLLHLLIATALLQRLEWARARASRCKKEWRKLLQWREECRRGSRR